MARALAELLGGGPIKQETANGGQQLFPAMDLQDGAGFEEVLRDGLKVLHVRADDDGNAGAGGLEDVVAATRRDGPAHEDHVRERVGGSKLADGVEQQYPGKL